MTQNTVLNSDIKHAPVDMNAVRVLMKAPWWAHLLEATKEAILHDPKVQISVYLDVAKAPPPNVMDRRNKRFGKVLVTGFSHQNRQAFKTYHGKPKPPPGWVGDNWNPRQIIREKRNVQVWFGICECGKLNVFKSGTLNRFARENSGCGNCDWVDTKPLEVIQTR